MNRMMRINNHLIETKEALTSYIDELDEKMEAIEDRAAEHDRDMTEKEEELYDALEERRNSMDEILDYISDALEKLHEVE